MNSATAEVTDRQPETTCKSTLSERVEQLRNAANKNDQVDDSKTESCGFGN